MTVLKKKRKVLKKIIVNPAVEADSSEIKNANIVLEHAINSVNKFYELFQKNRKGVMGGTTHVEQDLLRAMLVFSCSGLDAVVKQLIKDAVPEIINKESGAQSEFQKFIERRMKKGSLEEREKLALDTNWIASILASSTPREHLISALQRDLTDNSLQSRDELLRVAAHFAITQQEILANPEITKKAFDVRNEIIHEMDANLNGKKKRRQRTEADMVDYCKNILGVGSRFVNIVYKKIYGTP